MADSKSKFDGRARRDGGKQQRWRDAIAEQQLGGESVRDFCRQRGLPTSSFYHWRKKIGLMARSVQGKRKTLPVLAPVVVVDETIHDSVAELAKKTGNDRDRLA